MYGAAYDVLYSTSLWSWDAESSTTGRFNAALSLRRSKH